MVENTKNPIKIDLNEFKLYLHLQKNQLTFHFDSPSRRFYLSVIALVVNEMKRYYSLHRPCRFGPSWRKRVAQKVLAASC